MPDFHETRMGRRFIEGTMPKIANALERIADALERRNDLERHEEGAPTSGTTARPDPDYNPGGSGPPS